MEQGNDTVIAYANWLKKVWDELQCLEPHPKYVCNCTCGTFVKLDEISSSNFVMQFLVGLSDDYDHVVNNVLMMDPLPSFNKIYLMVYRIEKQKTVSSLTSKPVEASALLAKASSLKPPLKKKDTTKKEDRVCNHCGKNGHLEDACFKKHGYPEWFKEKYPMEKRVSTTANLASSDSDYFSSDSSNAISDLIQQEIKKYMSACTSIEAIANASYYTDFAGNTYLPMIIHAHKKRLIDSGASCHVCSSRSLMTDISPPKAIRTIQLPNGNVNKVTHVGTMVLGSNLILHDVLYVPEFQFKLLSVARLFDCSSVVVSFHKNGCDVQDLLSNKVLATSHMEKHLYILDEFHSSHHKLCSVSADVTNFIDTSSSFWHERMGHPSLVVLSKLPFTCNMPHKACTSCHEAKQTHLSFQKSFTRVAACFDLIHVDIWGSLAQASVTGVHYFLTFVDDHSRAIWISLMRNKGQAFSLLANF